MAKMESIVVEIGPNGEVAADVVNGPGGAGCLENLAKLLDGLGTPGKKTVKPEMYQAAVVGKNVATVKR